ncbi:MULTISPECIES: SDR family oxidoreductase [Shewanella]|uniref:SDR family oxidoreductase n=1 Tax=Shewanella TaxID=22 RepID=UPI001BBB94CD|nr:MULTISPECIES: SDR family oxidoreductase [Shewanella]GIU53820.1 short-chain dehydrogenase [Shewanella sp. KT0246]
MFRQNIIITGASSGLGQGMALEFAKQGANLGLCARRTDRLEELKSQINQTYPNVTVWILALDVNDHPQVFDVFEQFNSLMGTIDRVVVNAGMGKGGSIGTGLFEANKQTAQTNFVAALAQCEAAMKIFRQQNTGHLVTVSSISALRGFRRAMTVYAATKAGLTSLTEGIRLDVMNTPIAVTCVHPGYIKTEINDHADGAPFMVDAETGCRAMVKAINKEPANCYVPSYPWAFIQLILRILPDKLLRKMS